MNKSTRPSRDINAKIDDPANSFVSRIANILINLSQGKDNVTELAKSCHLSTSTVHRLLNVLKEPHFTVYDSVNHRYYLGPLISQLASNPSSNHHYLINCAIDEMKRLSDLTEETITLNLMLGLYTINLYDIQSKHYLKVQQTEDGYMWRMPILPFGAVAKMLLSQLSDRELSLALKSITVLNSNIRPTIDVESLTEQMKLIREQGFAVTCGEMTPGAMAISVPVKNYIFPVALVILGPESRLKSKVSQLTEELLASAKRISSNILEISR